MNNESESESVAASTATASTTEQCLHVTLEVTCQDVNIYLRKTMNTLSVMIITFALQTLVKGAKA